MLTLWSLDVHNAILKQLKITEFDYDYMRLIFKKQKLYTKN